MKTKDLIKKLGAFLPESVFKQKIVQCSHMHRGGIVRTLVAREQIVVPRGALKVLVEEGSVKLGPKIIKGSRKGIFRSLDYYELEMREYQLLLRGKIAIRLRLATLSKYVAEQREFYGKQLEVVPEYMKEVFSGRFEKCLHGPTTIKICTEKKALYSLDGIGFVKKEPLEVAMKFAPRS
jgi:hypothetical protein